jgi:hypothetical protein
LARKKLFYVVDWLPPDFGAVGQYGLGFATDLARAGRTVCLVGLTSGATRRTSAAVGSGRLETVRLSAPRYDKARLTTRLRWTLRTDMRLWWEVVRRREARHGDLLFTGSPPFFLYFAAMAKLVRRMRLTYRITDFYPEVLIAEAGAASLPLGLLQSFTWALRRRVDRFEVLGCDQKRILLAGGIPADRITLKRDTSPVVITGREPPAPRPPRLAGHAILIYSGNCGVAHEVDTVVGGFERYLRQSGRPVGLWLNATGRNADRLESALRDLGAPIARTDPIPLDQLPSLLCAADAHLVTLRPAFAGIVLPSKIYGCLASRRPIVFVGPQTSDINAACLEHSAAGYRHVEPGDIIGFAAALDWVARQPRRGAPEAVVAS